jgi:hypothetical protein
MSDIPIPEVPGPVRHGEPGVWQRLQALLVILIAVVAIVLAAWEGLENRRHNRLSVQPRLGGEYSSGRAGDSQYVRIAVENTGLGPAVIKSFRMYLDGREVTRGDEADRSRWNEIIAAVASDGMQVNAHAFGAGYFFPAGREYLLFEARGPKPDTGSISDIADRLGIDVCYCSIYGSHCNRVTLATQAIDLKPCPAN